jgi:hypothetical protein
LVFFKDEGNWRGKLAKVRITWTGPWSMQGSPVRAPSLPMEMNELRSEAVVVTVT